VKNYEFHEHFPDEISPKLHDYITNSVMDWSRYLFTHREGRKQWAYCTSCGQDHPTEETLIHGSVGVCPHCGHRGKVKASGRGRKNMIDIVYLLWYDRSQVNPNELIAYGLYCIRDYSRDYRMTNTQVRQISRYLFQWEQPGKMMTRSYWRDDSPWSWQKKVSSLVRTYMSNTLSYHMPPSEIADVVKGTPWQYCTWEQYKFNDYVEVFDLASRYQCIEFLTKAGFRHFVEQKLSGGGTYGAINWHGKTPEKVLRLNKSEINGLRKAGAIGLRSLKSYQVSKQDGSNLSFEEACTLSDLIEKVYVEEMKGILHQLDFRLTPAEIKKYFLKQIRNNPTRYRTGANVLTDYRDYLRECRELGLDLARPGVYLPNNLWRAHESTMRRVRNIADKILQQQIEKRGRSLKAMRYQFKDLILFPAPTADSLVREGKALSHCVGGYAKQYGSGHTDIYFIRRKFDPDKPFYTMEVKGGRVIQCRGYKNCDMTREVQEFVEMFMRNRLEKGKANKSKEVAV
jgi:DNA-directed RNA polymerase subunit RPC12/RpoP